MLRHVYESLQHGRWFPKTLKTRLYIVINVLEIMDDRLLTRLELAQRWRVSIETLKRRERARILRPVRLEGRIIRNGVGAR
jgi:hypothetical protein